MKAFRLCVDLNVWVSHFLARANSLSGTATRIIVEAVQDGRAGIGPVQLVVSHSMLYRLQDVLLRKGASLDTSTLLISQIAAFALLGPAQEFPGMVLGGGTEPTQDAKMPQFDPYDSGTVPDRLDAEDGRVLDAALAGDADALVTNNFRDFVHHQDIIVIRDRVHIRQAARKSLVILRPVEAALWLQTGQRRG